MRRLRRKIEQLELRPKTWGGRRNGAGRPRTGGVTHLRRPDFPARLPLHITLRVRRDVPSLRANEVFRRIQRAFFYGHYRFGMRMVEFSVQRDHVHFIVEAAGRRALSRGMQGLAIRVARAVNRMTSRYGKVFADRYHARLLKTLAEVRNAIHYVRTNWHKHQRQNGRWSHPWWVDPRSSMSGEACWYVDELARAALVVATPRSWLVQHATPS